jgi:ankyrin repeat protein
MFADCLDLHDISTLVRTTRALNRLLTPYLYQHAKDLESRDGKPYFLEAVDAGNLAAVRRFIEVGTSINMRDPTPGDRATALHSCVRDGNIQIAQLLIQHGVNMSPVNYSGHTPLHDAIGGESEEIWVRLLVDAGADISASGGFYGTILCKAMTYGSPSTVQLLLQRGAIPTIWNLDGDTLLHCPQWEGTAATVGLFLEAGLNIEATNEWGETPLHHAAGYGREDYVKELLQWGANVDATDNEGRTPLQAFLDWRLSASTARHILHHETLPEVSKGSQACVPTCRSVEFHEPVTDLLLSAGANIRASRNSTRSPLDWATLVLSGDVSRLN